MQYYQFFCVYYFCCDQICSYMTSDKIKKNKFVHFYDEQADDEN